MVVPLYLVRQPAIAKILFSIPNSTEVFARQTQHVSNTKLEVKSKELIKGKFFIFTN
jgi:hypothetical protein